jgi:hypothetical protein
MHARPQSVRHPQSSWRQVGQRIDAAFVAALLAAATAQ